MPANEIYSQRIIFTLIIILCYNNCLSGVFAKTVSNGRLKRTTISEDINNNNDKYCKNVNPYFQFKNITISRNGKGSICDGECCDNETESLLIKQGRKDFAELLRHNSRSVQGLLSSTADTLQNHVTTLTYQSENKTITLFETVYQTMAVHSREPIEKLYMDIREYININSTIDKNIPTVDIKSSVMNFFTDLFPLAYHRQLSYAPRDFTLNYKTCLKKSVETIYPFGETPQEITQSLSKSLEATRLLLQALAVGIEVLNTTDSLLIDENAGNNGNNAECYNALFRMTYCPKCKALVMNTKPCRGYCLNVLRGCISKYVNELDLPWNGYVESVESLLNEVKKVKKNSQVIYSATMMNGAGLNPDVIIKSLDTKISVAIMYTMEKGKEIDAKVKSICGVPEFSQKEDPLVVESFTTVSPPSNGKPRLTPVRLFKAMPEVELNKFLFAIIKTKGFYANLADSLCQDDSFSESTDRNCWNGERIADYQKTVVDVKFDMQKYNPEVKSLQHIQHSDPRLATLVDKLRHVHHLTTKTVDHVETDVDYMQRDGAEGSGSGIGPSFDEEDDGFTRGSGSGGGPPDGETKTKVYHIDEAPKTTYDHPKVQIAGSTTISKSVLVSTVLNLIFVFVVMKF